jgi:hypothetical protein
MLPKEDFETVKGRVIGFVQKNENPPLSGLSRRPKP